MLYPHLPSALALLLWSSALLTGCQSMSVPETALSPLATSTGADSIALAVGTYTKDGSEGIYRVSYDPVTAQFGEVVLAAPAQNASFLRAGAGDLLLGVSETDTGKLVSYRIAGERLTELDHALTGGASPCYVALHPSGAFAATANYMGGNVSIFGLAKDGSLAAEPQILQHQGQGPHRERQEAPHAHWVQWHPAGHRLYAVDLGIDEVRVYDFEPISGASSGRTALALQPGDGPRHLAFHPLLPLAYVVNELSNSLVVASVNADGGLTERQRLSTLPPDLTDHSQVAHLALSADGKHLYVSNRGHNSIAVFELDGEGVAKLLEIEPSGGDWPRHFSLLDEARSLIVANQEGGNLVAFKIESDGRLTPTGAVTQLAQPTYVGPLR